MLLLLPDLPLVECSALQGQAMVMESLVQTRQGCLGGAFREEGRI